MIKVESISKKFKLYRSPKDRLKEIILRRPYHKEFQALDNINFVVADGETLGIIGQNGAGKSTLLKILMGILLPDRGKILIDGKTTGLLELGTGFNYEMNGLQNIYMNGSLLGMNREEIDNQKERIIDFSELGKFIEEPLKTYSSGMALRLAFSIAINANPKCFVVDEALAVGDAHFQQKCMNKIREFRENGGSIVFVSHDMNAIKMLCDRAILLNHGDIIDDGEPETVVNSYNFLIAKLNDSENRIYVEDKEKLSHGTFDARIKRVSIEGEDSKSNLISSGENATIAVEIEAYDCVDDINIGILIRDRFGQDIFGTNTYHYNLGFNLERGKKYVCTFNLEMNIGPGKYTITAAVHTKDTHLEHCLHWINSSIEFEVAGNHGEVFIGLCKLYPEIEIKDFKIL